MAGLVARVTGGTLSGTNAKQVFARHFESGELVEDIVASSGLMQISDEAALVAAVDGVIATHPGAVADYRAGKAQAAGFLVGALISGLNFFILKGLVDRLGGARPRRRGPLLGLRYVLLAGGAYVILRLTPISLPAVLAGIFVFTAAVFIEVIFEIAHAGK